MLPVMLWRALVIVCAMAGVLAPVAGAAPLPGTSTPLPGSTFQGGDGDQDDEGSSIDWQGLHAAGRVVHSPDEGQAFKSGSKEDAPGNWVLVPEGDGVTPAKDNILDAWSSVDQPAADTFAYLGFTREKGNGDTYVAFELNRDARLWNNGHDEIPCRQTGDVAIAMLAHGNGIDLVLQRWITELSDAFTGCATHGHFEAVATVPAGSAQGDVNQVPITSRLPGTFAPGTQIRDAGLFGEASVNLSALFQAAFGDRCFTFSSVWMHSRSSESESSNLQDYLAPHAVTVRSCTASGFKFFDVNANGRRDPGEPGIPRFLIWADYNGDGVRQSTEPFSVSDRHGRYVISDIKPPTGRYTLREMLLSDPQTTAWLCSYPNAGTPGGFANGAGGLFGCGWGPIDATTTPRAPNRDFGNWVPARLTVRKRLWPASDSGRFDLKVNGITVLPAAGDGSTTTIAVPAGSYVVSEAAAPPTDATAYRSAVSCRRTPRLRGSTRPGTSFARLVLLPGSQATCTFANVRPGTPAIAIEKTGPTAATAGDVLHYALYVTNPGDVPIRASAVRVSDDRCDDAPVLTGKSGAGGADGSPGTLDPGDTWAYECSHATPAARADCALTVVTNTATASGTAGGTTVSDTSSVRTSLRCPDQPPEPPVPDPGPVPGPFPNPSPPPPTPVAPVSPPGPVPPIGGVAGAASVNRPSGCITRVSQLQLTGVRMDRVRVSVDGRPQSTRKLAILQERLTPLSRVFSPGRHVVTLRVVFQPGSDSAAVTLRRVVTVCPRRATLPRFTG